MCDIWKKKTSKADEMPISSYRALPDTLRDINITGGEPFLRDDLPEIIRTIKATCPKARIVISTNGILVNKIRSRIPKILEHDSNIAVRVSIDGMGPHHDSIRGISDAFKKAIESASLMKHEGVRDFGIAMTLTSENDDQLLDVYRFAKKLDIEFSVTLVSGSEIYFGTDKADLRPRVLSQLATLSKQEYLAWKPKHWFRGWFAETLLHYANTGERNLACDAGSGFFYLDPTGDIYACHLKSARIGNLQEQSFASIWDSARAIEVQNQLKGCQDCWMICTCKSEFFKQRIKIGQELLRGKVGVHMRGIGQN
jgi:radical SAM protein with 4Fe4S-binding SPASM domain